MLDDRVSCVVSFAPSWVTTYEEWRNVVFVAHALLSDADLESFGKMLAEYGFGHVTKEAAFGDTSDPFEEETIPDPTTPPWTMGADTTE
jgi:hypothetical protein